MDRSKIVVVPNVMRGEELRFTAEGRARVRGELGIPDDAFVVGLISRFHPKKRNDVIVDAVKQLPERAHLILAGAGETEAELRAKAEPLGDRAHIVPTPGDDVADYTSAFEIGVFCPSPTEGAPRAVILPSAATALLMRNVQGCRVTMKNCSSMVRAIFTGFLASSASAVTSASSLM